MSPIASNSHSITSKSTNRFSIISITNWEAYQGIEDDSQPASQPANQPATNQQITTYKNNKEKDLMSDIPSEYPTMEIPPFPGEAGNLHPQKHLKDNKKISPEDSDAYSLSEYLLKNILERKPSFRRPNLQKWATHIDRMLRIDKRNPDRVAEVIEWVVQNNHFVVLSAEALREKFDRIEVAMERGWK